MEATQEINGLHYDFIHRQGLVMKLHREGGIFAEELSALQLRMLESNAIPKLLPLEVQEIDFQISLLYNLNSKRMLSQVIKAEGLTRAQLFKLLYTILCALDNSGNYMLNETQYLLKGNFIFIGSEITDIYLTYLPFQQLVGEIPIHHQVGTLIQQLVEKVKEGEREGFDVLQQACAESFKLSSFKQLLLELMGEKQKKKGTNAAATPLQYELQTQFQHQSKLPSSPAALNKEAFPSFSPMPSPLLKKNSESESPKELKNHSDEERKPFLLTQRNRLIVLIGISLILAFLWKSCLDHQQDGFLYLASGVSILLIDAWFVLSFIGLPSSWRKLGLLKRNKSDMQDDSALMGNWLLQASPKDHQQVPETKKHVDVQDYYRNLHQHTTLLSAAPSNATVFLGANQVGESLKVRTSMIEVNKEGNKQHIPINGNSFIIGRGETEADYAENEAGISRLHAEIFKAVEGYGIKDLGSKNGTFLNEEQLVPYQSYTIKEGDTIRIVRTEFRLIVDSYKNMAVKQSNQL